MGPPHACHGQRPQEWSPTHCKYYGSVKQNCFNPNLTICYANEIMHCNLIRANDFPRSRQTDGIREIYPVKRNCIFPTDTSFYESKSTHFTPFSTLTLILLIAANAVTLRVLIAACRVYM